MTIAYQPSPLPGLTLYATVPDEAAAVEIPATFADASSTWLVQESAGLASPGQPVFLLLHADDGIIWGRITQNTLTYPTDGVWTPPLRSITVQQCRLFGDLGELFIWREAENVWRGRKLTDDPIAHYQLVTERPFLIGDRIYDPAKDRTGAPLPTTWPTGFTPIIEVTTGMRQIVPCNVVGDEKGVIAPTHRPRLTVLHYLHEDEDGQSLVAYSRLKNVAAN
jgi:CRISPR-associated protein (TIGR03984 family)